MAGALQLRRFQTTLFKDQSASSDLQVPADGASVQVYKQGATVRTGTTVTSGNVAVTVYGVGRLLAGDNVQKGTDSTKQMTVVSVDSDTQVTLTRAIGEDITLSAEDRLVVYSSPPTLYSDGAAVTSITNPVTLGSSGLLAFYCPETRFDYIVSGTGITTSLFIDNEGGWAKGGSSIVNAKDYPTFQAALNALPTTIGGVVEIPAGTFTPSTTPAFTGVTLKPGTTFRGAGRDSTTLQLTSTSSTHIQLVPASAGAPRGGVNIEDMTLTGAGSAGSGFGINLFDDDGTWTSNVVVRNVYINNTPSWGISYDPDTVGYFIDQCLFENVTIGTAKSGGSCRIGRGHPNPTSGGNTMTFIKCQFNGPSYGTYGPDSLPVGALHISQSTNLNFVGCSFQGENVNNTYVSFGSVTRNVGFYNCLFENNFPAATAYWINVNAVSGITGLTVVGCTFSRYADSSMNLIQVGNSSALSGALFQNCFFYCQKTGAAGTADIQLGTGGLSDITLVNNIIDYAALGTTTTLPIANPTAKVQIIETSQWKLPALTTTQRGYITPLAGHLIFNDTTNKLNFYDGTGWVEVTSP